MKVPATKGAVLPASSRSPSAPELLDLEQTTFVIPENDGEAKEIIRLLRARGADVRVSKQGWGARLDQEPAKNLQGARLNIVVVEMPSPELEARLEKDGHRVFVVDHHDYEGLSRHRPESSLEQVAKLIGHELDRAQLGVAINDRSYIYGLAEHGYSKADIARIRESDVSAQGVSSKDLAVCKAAYQRRVELDGLTVVVAKTTKVSFIGDLHTLSEPDRVRDLLIVSMNKGAPVEANFYGDPDRALALQQKLGGWSGGGDKSKFWGTNEVELASLSTALGQPRLLEIVSSGLGARRR